MSPSKFTHSARKIRQSRHHMSKALAAAKWDKPGLPSNLGLSLFVLAAHGPLIPASTDKKARRTQGLAAFRDAWVSAIVIFALASLLLNAQARKSEP
jgi:hypothetical protein